MNNNIDHLEIVLQIDEMCQNDQRNARHYPRPAKTLKHVYLIPRNIPRSNLEIFHLEQRYEIII